MILLNNKRKLVPKGPFQLMYRVYRYVLPEVAAQLAYWRDVAENIPDQELKKQAIASMTSKRFHCEGGAIYAAANLPKRDILIPLIVAFQTISDYLDNLCDRSTSMNPDDFRLLHQSMLDAANPDALPRNYYALRKESEDGGYLSQLVQTCQACIKRLPTYAAVSSQVHQWVSLYCDLQVYKHIELHLREAELHRWWEEYRLRYHAIYWNEFAAATGSTLGVFTLFLAAADEHLASDAVETIRETYFPYVCGLHILLDYLIDQEEDRIGGDLNFCNYYEDMDDTVRRLAFIVEQARERVSCLKHAAFHRMIIEGLLALYLSDPKVRKQPQVQQVSKRLMKNSPLTRLFFWINSVFIRTASRSS